MVKKRFSETLTLYSRIGGSIDEDTKAYKKGTRTAYYEGRANVQELSLRDRLSYQTGLNAESIDVDLKIHLPLDILKDISIHDLGEVKYSDGTIYQIQITGLNRLSNQIYATYVSGKS